MDKKQVQKSLKVFTLRVKAKFKPKQILLFGSYSTGKHTTFSDIDIAVISNKFKSIPQEKRLDVLYPLTADLYPDFHVFGFTPTEFKKASSLTTVAEIKKQGIDLTDLVY